MVCVLAGVGVVLILVVDHLTSHHFDEYGVYYGKPEPRTAPKVWPNSASTTDTCSPAAGAGGMVARPHVWQDAVTRRGVRGRQTGNRLLNQRSTKQIAS